MAVAVGSARRKRACPGAPYAAVRPRREKPAGARPGMAASRRRGQDVPCVDRRSGLTPFGARDGPKPRRPGAFLFVFFLFGQAKEKEGRAPQTGEAAFALGAEPEQPPAGARETRRQAHKQHPPTAGSFAQNLIAKQSPAPPPHPNPLPPTAVGGEGAEHGLRPMHRQAHNQPSPPTADSCAKTGKRSRVRHRPLSPARLPPSKAWRRGSVPAAPAPSTQQRTAKSATPPIYLYIRN
ncbi:hypothetical protein DFR29_103109 [Tahibacter aquaticus]|uniref:Uncharacterized protein n=1 Tax=Tahibacter aquaticus TaxID=520092 RepID=A0A4R6Z4I0_9GAMM|nr:hypothetical protein DFR29_103109 [Tahibacter aquaticus]